MPDTIKYNEVVDPGLRKGLEADRKKLEQIDKLIAKIKSSKVTAPKGSSGADAKKLNQITNQRIKSTKKLTDAKKEQLKLEKQIDQNITKSNSLKETRLKLAERTKQVNAERNRQIKESIQISQSQKGSIQRLRLENNKLVKQRDRLNTSTKKGAKEFKNLTRRIAQQEKALKKYDKAIGRSQRNVGNYGKSIKGLAGRFAGALGLVGGIMLARRALVGMFNTFKDFDKAQSKLASILGTTKEGIADLTETAIQLGRTMVFTASEISALQTELAKLGFDQGEIVNAQRGILNLAAATGTDLAEAAAISGAALRSFGLDAREMSRVTDVMALATSKSALDMQKLSVALPKVSATAKVAGISIERTAALLGTLADRGLDASTIGTSLRNVFLELSKKGLTWEQAMKKINIATDKNVVALELFGKRGATTGVILAENAESVEKLETALNGAAGAAERMAKIQLDNLAGDITKMTSAWEGFILSLEKGDGVIATTFRNLTQNVTGFLNDLSNIGKTVLEVEILNNADFAKKSVDKFLNGLSSSMKELAIKNEALVKESNARINEILSSDEALKKLKEKGKLQEAISNESFKNLIDFTKVESEFTTEQISKLAEIGKLQADIQGSISNRNELAKRGNLTEAERIARIKDEISLLETANEIDKKRAGTAALTAKFKLISTNATSVGLKFDKEDADNLTAKEKTLVSIIGKRTTEIKLFKDALEISKNAAKQAVIDAENQKIIDAERLAAAKLEAAKNFIAKDSIKGLNKEIARLNKLRDETSAQSPELIIGYDQEIEKLKKMKELLENISKIKERRAIVFEAEKEGEQTLLERLGGGEEDVELALRTVEEGMDEIIASVESKKNEIDVGDSFLAKVFGVTDEDADLLRGSLQKIAGIMTDFLSSQFEAQQAAARREVDLRESNLQALRDDRRDAIALIETGNAAELDLINRRIKEEERLRDQAIEAEKKAVERQRIIQTIAQVGNLVLAASEIFANEGKEGAPGVIVAIAAIAAMLAAFAAFQSQAGGLETGGTIRNGVVTASGKRHNADGSGGERIDKFVNVQAGEDISVFTREASAKHHNLIERFTNAANTDNLGSLQFSKIPSIEQNDFNVMFSNAELIHQNERMIEQNDTLIGLISRQKHYEEGREIDLFGNITSNKTTKIN